MPMDNQLFAGIDFPPSMSSRQSILADPLITLIEPKKDAEGGEIPGRLVIISYFQPFRRQNQ